MTYLLHIDTSTDTGIVAITGDAVLLAASYNDESRNHAGAINNMIEKVAVDAKIKLTDISSVVVCAGPGSYTGLRIGMATAKGLCYALDKPLIADNRLDMLAYKVQKKYGSMYTQYVSLLIARDKEYFIAIYNNDMVCTLAPQHIMEEQLEELVFKKDKTYITTNASISIITDLKIDDFTIDSDIKTDTNAWGQQAFEKYICNRIVNLSTAEPFYLKQVYTHK